MRGSQAEKDHGEPAWWIKGSSLGARQFPPSRTDPKRPAEHEPFVHLFDKKGKRLKPRSPKNIFNMPDLYTVFRGQERDIRFEQQFSRLEKDFVRVRRLIEKGDWGGPDGAAALYAFTAAMLVRPPHKIDEVANHWSSVAKMARSIRIDPSKPPLPVLKDPDIALL